MLLIPDAYWVKVSNGIIVDGPHPLSRDITFVPNVYWPDHQLALHGYAIVDLSRADDEKIDLSRPTINGTRVTFPKRKKNAEETATESADRLARRKAVIIDAYRAMPHEMRNEVKEAIAQEDAKT